MLNDVAIEALRFLDRTALDEFQIGSRYLRDFVNRHAYSLAIRYIPHVEVSAFSVSKRHFSKK